MSSITSALQYKVQKMQQQMNSLMEENAKLRSILIEANIAGMSPTQAFNYGGGAALGQNLAMQPNIGVAGMASASRGMSPTSTSYSTSNMTPAARSLATQAAGGGGQFDGAAFGQFLATLGNNPQAQQMLANYLAQFGGPVATGALSAAGGRRNTNNLSTRR